MRNSNSKRPSQAGFTIVELMIAATLGLLILAGAISMLVSNKRIYTEQDEMGRLQENARFALDLLIRDIRMAGYAGCAGDVNNVVNHLNGADTASNIHAFVAVEGSEGNGTVGNWQPSGSSDQNADMLPFSDGITTRYLTPIGIHIVEPFMVRSAAAIHVTTDHGIESGDIVSITDCSSADVVQVTGNPSNPNCACSPSCTTAESTSNSCKATFNHNSGSGFPGNVFKDLSKTYGADATIMRFYAARYFIGNVDGSPMLRRMTGVSNTDGTALVDDLVDGVENMQVLYGEDTVGGDMIADTYVDADTVGNWDNVVSVRLALLMRTVTEYGTQTDASTYDLLGVNINPTDDRRRRRVFTVTVQIRNRRS